MSNDLGEQRNRQEPEIIIEVLPTGFNVADVAGANSANQYALGNLSTWADQIAVLSGPETEDRYTRLRQLGWDLELLRSSWVMVVGAGALGNEVLKNLALLGVGHVLVVDMDAIEDTNLARSVLFRPSDVGRLKAEVAAERVREINHDVDIRAMTQPVQESFGLGVYRRMDVVFGCLDNRQARLDVSRACWRTLTPYIDAGLLTINGDVQVFIPPLTACYGCTLTHEARRQAAERHPCLRVKINVPKPTIPTAPTISSIMAAWQTQIAVKHLHSLRIPAGERIALYGLPDEVDRYRRERNPLCQDHSDEEIIDEAMIVELPHCTSRSTVAELVEMTRTKANLGPGGVVQFDFDVALSGRCNNQECPSYGVERSFYRRLSFMSLDEITCPGCDLLLDVNTEYEFDGTEPFASRTLTQMGLPPLHMVTGKGRNNDTGARRYVTVEVSGDLTDFFARAASHNPKLLRVRVFLPNGQGQQDTWLSRRLPLGALVEWRVATWGLPPLVDARYSVRNRTQGFTYDPPDTLDSRGTRPGDELEFEAVTEIKPRMTERTDRGVLVVDI